MRVLAPEIRFRKDFIKTELYKMSSLWMGNVSQSCFCFEKYFARNVIDQSYVTEIDSPVINSKICCLHAVFDVGIETLVEINVEVI